MVAHRRIDPDGGLLREIIDVRRRVQHVETRPSGVIATREMFIVTDPETGVQTIMGKLPDGSTGFQPFVGDIVPPPVATAPTASAQPGTITVSWDGTFVGGAEQPADFEHLNVIGHKIVTGTTVLSLEVGSIRLANESVIVNTDIISYGEQWQFSFESEDYNGNISVRSDRTPLIDVISYVDDSLVGEALSAIEADVVAAQQASADAQIAADDAQAAADAVAMNLSSTSAEVTAAQLKADQAFNNAASAATAAGNAQTSADSKNKIWYQTTAPAGTGHKAGDTWFDTDDGNRVYLWTGAAWTDHRDTGIAAAQTAANTALTSANGKNKNYYQTTMPTGGTYILGDTWFDTDDGNKIYVHNGTTFVNAQDASIAAAQSTATTASGTANTALSTANNKTKTYFQTAQPSLTGNTIGDLWFDTDDSNRVYAWNGASWASARDAGIASAASAASTAQQDATAALTAAQAAQAVADGAIRTFYQSAAPTGLNDTTNVGDLWFDTDDGQAYRWNGTAWVIIEDNSIAAALAAAQNAQTTADGKITTYYQPGQPATGEVGDLWFDTDDKNKPYYCSSIAPLTWAVVRDGTIADAQSTANTALTAANGKNVNYYQTTMPSGGTYIKGDTWFDTDDGNKIYVHNGTTFVSAQDTAIAAAQSTATSKTKTFVSATAPTATTQGDIWIDTANGNVIKTWEGSTWVNRADTAIAAAQTAANSAQTSANGRNKIYYQTTMPSGGTYIAGDTWFDTDDGNKIYVHNGTTFVAAPLGTNAIANLAITDAQIAAATISNAKIANLDAAKITTGTLDANRIGANSITANKIFVGDYTNLAADGNFTDTTKANWLGSGTVVVSAGQPNRLRVVTAASGNNDQPNNNLFQVVAGEQLYAECWVYGEPTNVGAGGPNLHFAVLANDGTPSWPIVNSATRLAVSGNWVKLSGSVTMPANAKTARVEPAVSFSADAVGNIYYFREVVARRKNTGSLIVDGAIQAGSAIIGTGAIGTAQIGDLAVTNAKIADATIQSAKIGSVDAGTISVGTLSAARIGADTITASHIASDAITANELAANSITAAKGQISDLAVTNAKIADLAVTNAKIADATIASAKIANLDAGKITSGTIDANRIGANTINVTKLAVSDFTNLATLDEVNGVNVTSYGQTQIVGGYAKLVADSGTFLMFTDRRGPVPFKTGDRLYYEFTAKATAATTAKFAVYTYDALDVNENSFTGNLNIGTTDTLIKGELIVASVRPNAVQFVLGLQEVSNKGIQVKGVRVYKKLGGELVVDGSITTNHMTSGTIDAGVLTAGSITAPKIAAKTIGVDKLTITSTDNLIVGGDMALSAASWQKGTYITASAATGRGGGSTLRFAGSIVAQTSLNLSNRVTVEPDHKFRCSISVKSDAALAIDTVKLMVRCYTTATAYTDIVGVSNTDALVANTWTQLKGVSEALPANTIAVEFYLRVTNPATGTITDIDYVAVTRAADGSLIVDGSVTATKLESDLILATKIVAGDPNKTHAEMSPQGFRVFAENTSVSGGAPTEVVRLGVANTNDYFAVTKSDGALAASISQDGVISGAQVNANSSLYYKGTELTEILRRMPKGNVAYGSYSANITATNNIGMGLFDLGFNAEAGRAYRISGYVRGYLSGGNGQITTQLKVAYGGAVPSVNSSSLTVDGHSALDGHWNTYYFNKFVHFNPAGAADAWARVLLVAGREVGPGVFNTFESLMSVDDIGIQFSPTGTVNTGGGTSSPAKINYVKQYGCNNSMNYQGNNSQYNFDTGRMYQGLSPAGYGNLKSIALFPDMTADLSGATINYIRVYFNFAHWYYNSGGTARIGLHGHTSIPGTFGYAGGGQAVSSGGWPKPGARWVDIPSAYWDAFKSGNFRGVALEGDSTYGTYGYADRPTIEINYTK